MSQIELTETRRTRIEATEEDQQIGRSRNFIFNNNLNNNLNNNFETQSQISQVKAGVAKTGEKIHKSLFIN